MPETLTARQIADVIATRFGQKVLATFADDKHPRVEINSADWLELATFLVTDVSLRFDWLANLGGIDYVADGRLCVVYDLWSFDLRHTFAVKVYCPRDHPVIPSVAKIWPAADWHEREAFDMFGIVFEGHPDPRRILCADDWVGHPLLKDYVFPREYHGIPGSVELDWQQKRE